MFGIFGRLGRAFGARLDGMITRVENHEALFASAVRELERTLERAERERERTLATRERFAKSLAEENEAAALWRERALREPIEARGIECLRRSKRALRRSEELRTLVAEQATLERRLEARLAFLRGKLAEFREREELLRTRQLHAENPGETATGTPTALDAAELLERWETQVREAEIAGGSLPPFTDDPDDEPRDAAEEATLVYELRELKEKTR